MAQDNNQHFGARVTASISALVTLVIIGMVGFHHFEHWNWIESFYFTVTTLTTVAYGDLHPTTDGSRLFAAIFVLLSVGVALTALTTLGTAYLERRTSRLSKRRAIGR